MLLFFYWSCPHFSFSFNSGWPLASPLDGLFESQPAGRVNPTFRVNMTSGCQSSFSGWFPPICWWWNPQILLGSIPISGQRGPPSIDLAGCVLHALSQLPPQHQPQMEAPIGFCIGIKEIFFALEIQTNTLKFGYSLDLTDKNKRDSGKTKGLKQEDLGSIPRSKTRQVQKSADPVSRAVDVIVNVIPSPIHNKLAP